MIRRRFQPIVFSLLIELCACSAGAQRNGMYFDHRNNYFIPLQNRDALIGHAYVILADRISRDSNLFIIGVYDQYLTNVGERKISMPREYSFDCAAFDGKDIYTRFIDEGRAVRYLAFDQQSAIVMDTTLALKCRRAPVDMVSYYQQASIFPIDKKGIVDNVVLSGKGPASATVRVTAGGPVWVNTSVAPANAGNKILLADDRVVVEAVSRFAGRGASPDVRQTSILTLDAQTGARLGETVLGTQTNYAFHPVNAAVVADEIEVVSEFTRQPRNFGRVKYGASIHRLKLADGSQIGDPAINEFTTTLLKDSTIKGRQLMTNSYLYISHAARSDKGHWLLAMQQFSKLPMKVGVLRNRAVRYEMRSICFVELGRDAAVLSSHQELNSGNVVSVPAAFFYNPQNSGTYMAAKNMTDVGYFVSPDETNRQLAFVYADVSKDRKLRIGNVLFRDGRYDVDKLTRSPGANAMAGILPARFGHTYLVSFDMASGKFSFDNIKFNN